MTDPTNPMFQPANPPYPVGTMTTAKSTTRKKFEAHPNPAPEPNCKMNLDGGFPCAEAAIGTLHGWAYCVEHFPEGGTKFETRRDLATPAPKYVPAPLVVETAPVKA